MELSKYLNHLKSGGVLVYPTETVWGIGADFQNKEATQKIFEIKERDKHQALSLLLPSIQYSKEIAEVSPQVEKLLTIFWPGPVTFVLPAKKAVKEFIHGGTGFVGLRFSPSHFLQSLLLAYGRPISTTSVNRSGEAPARSYEELEWVGHRALRVSDVDSVNDPDKIGSTVVKIEDSKYKILREGDFSVENFSRAARLLGFSESSD